MHELSLPTAEETSVKITIGEKSFIIDYFDHQAYIDEAFTQMRETGTSSNTLFAELVRDIYKEKHNVDMSVGTASVLIAEFNKVEDVLKKKFSSLQEIFDSLDSTGDPKPEEISNSSTMPESV